jgi:hypothetical protein
MTIKGMWSTGTMDFDSWSIIYLLSVYLILFCAIYRLSSSIDYLIYPSIDLYPVLCLVSWPGLIYSTSTSIDYSTTDATELIWSIPCHLFHIVLLVARPYVVSSSSPPLFRTHTIPIQSHGVQSKWHAARPTLYSFIFTHSLVHLSCGLSIAWSCYVPVPCHVFRIIPGSVWSMLSFRFWRTCSSGSWSDQIWWFTLPFPLFSLLSSLVASFRSMSDRVSTSNV